MTARQEIRLLLGCLFWGITAHQLAIWGRAAFEYEFPMAGPTVAADLPSAALIPIPELRP